ncbi:hypothetical protein J1N35_013610 [Gossypium stocksii]|uniref:DUF4283 domain-containing protein n=1 Tax=Gossypium stocksii TaxID=47602 RepID=A0A9D3VV73_9ROSI|nr:hypothetical protein J1N35_013610 [Gossypium stocksii]
MVLAWIRLPGLLGFLYKKKILEEIGGIIGKVVLLDLNTDSRNRGRFTRMAIYINLDKPLIAQILVNGMKQRVEYEALPTICSTYRKHGHTKELCASLQPELTPGKDQMKVTPTEVGKGGKGAAYGPWMVEVNVDDGLTMTSKPASSMSNLVEVQATDSSGRLNRNKHTAVSFKEKGPADGVNKNRSIGKLIGGGIWVG